MRFKKGDWVKLKGTKHYANRPLNKEDNWSDIEDIASKDDIYKISEVYNEEYRIFIVHQNWTFTDEDLEPAEKSFIDTTIGMIGKEELLGFNDYTEGKMELKDIQKENLKEALKQFNEEKTTEEVKLAKKKLYDLINMRDNLERQYKELDEAYEKIQAELDMFEDKPKRRD